MAKDFTYKMNIDADVGALTSKLKTLRDALASVTSDGKEPKIAKILDQLGTRIDNIKTKAATPIKSEAAFAAMEKEIQGVQRLLESLGVEIGNVGKKANAEKISFLPEAEQKKLLAIVDAMKKYDSAIDTSTKKSKELRDAEKKQLSEEGKLAAKTKELEERRKSLAAAEAKANAAKLAKEAAEKRRDEADAAEEQYQKIKKLAEARKKDDPSIDLRKAEFDDGQGGKTTLAAARGKAQSTAHAAEKDDLDALTQTYRNARDEAQNFQDSVNRLAVSVKNQESAAKVAADKVKELTTAFDANKLKASNDAFDELKRQAKDLGINLQGIGADNTPENVELLKQRMEEFVAQGVQPANDQLQQAVNITEQYRAAANAASESNRRETETFREQNEAAGEVNGLVNRIKQFTGLTGVALVMRRALQSAINTTKELDKQMTEMAVVTDLEVGDYWKQLPEHTRQANALGVAIKDVYEAETLYYQQGLKTAQVQKLSTSTLKMARIAGLSAEDATNKMTAALRGFNMEINETNADRIADVYSKLAAITASNVQEISTAMTKTASLAANAGMQFETTAAFLSQVIETTRESAETAGTALKTVIARFQELKKSPEEIGEVEGEIVDANKIETALRSVGVALRDAQGQFRDLDDVFIELSSKWDSLDTNTQRYIATIAAGSRQQSRFVAMMSNYARTQELVNAANNAAGASNEQFEKTLSSLQSKLAQLHNAWDTFTQGIANNEFIKGAVDILTGILDAINKITEGFGPWSGSALKIGLVVAALVAGDKAIKIFLASLRGGSSVLGAFGKVATAAGAGIKTFSLNLSKSLKSLVVTSKATLAATKSTAAYKTAETAAAHAKAVSQHANDQLAKSEAYLSKLKMSGTASTEALNKAEEIRRLRKEAVARANEKEAASEAELAAAMGFSEAQMANYNALLGIQNAKTGESIGTDAAYILTKNGITASTIAEAAAARGMTEAEYAEELAKKLGNATGLKAILIKANEAVVTWMKTAADKAETGGIWAKVAAYIAEKIAIIEVQTAMPPLLIITLLLTAAILALVATIFIIVGLVKLIKANTLEGQIEAQKEKVKQYNEALENSKTALDDLREAHDKYKELQDTYKNLTKGTKEWRQALVEANQQVLQLIQKYPELTKYLKRDGEALTIEEEGWDHILEKQQQAVNLNAAAALGAQAQLSQLTAKKDTRDYYDTYSQEFQSENFLTAATNLGTMKAAVASLNPVVIGLTGGIMKVEKEFRRVTDDWGAFGTILQGAHTGALLSTFMGPVLGNIVGFAATIISQQAEEKRREQTQDFAAAMVENGLSFEEIDREAVKDLYQSIFDKEMTDEIYDAMAASSDALFELGNATLAARIQMDTFAQQLVTNALDMANITNEWRTSLQGFGAGELSGENVEGKIDEAVKELSKSMDYDDALKQYAELTGQSYAQGKVYSTSDITQQTEDTEVKVSKDIVWQVLAQNKVTGEAATRLDNVSVELSRAALTMTKSEKERTKRLLSNDASALTQSDLKAITEAGGAQQWLTQHGVNVQLTDDELAKITESIDNANKDSESRLAKLQKTGNFDAETMGNITEGLTGLGIQGLVEKFSTLTDRFGEETTVRTAQIIEDFGNQLSSPELREAFNAQVAAADWSNTESFENLTEVLGTMADLTAQDTIVLQTWSKAMGTTVHALTTINLDNLRKQVASLNKTINDMFEGNRDLDDEAYQNLIDMGFSEQDFQKTAEGVRYLGQTGDLMRSASAAAYQGVAAANANFEAARAETEHSLQVISDLEKEIAEHANDRRETTVRELSATEAIWEWLKKMLGKIRDHLVAFGTWIYDHIIKPIGDALTKVFNTIYDVFVWMHNTIGSVIANAWAGFCNVFIDLCNGFIKFYNDTLGWLFGEIEYFERQVSSFEAMETSEQIARREALEEQQKKVVQDIETYTEKLQEVAKAYAQAADAIDIGALRTAQEKYVKEYQEVVEKMNAATSETVRNAYKKEIEVLQSLLDNLDKSLMSKALAYEDLAPDVQRFQEALKKGNTEVAEDLRQKLANAIASKDAAKRLNKAFTKIGEDLESVLSDDISVDALQSTLEQWSYTLGFHNIDEGVQLLAQNFNLLGQIIEGDEDAWKSFQTSMLTSKGFHVEGDIDVSEINAGLTSLGDNAQDALDSLLDTGAFKMQQITATNRVSVPKISYNENGYATVDGVEMVEAGQMYWQLVPSDFGDLDIEQKDLSGEAPEKWINPYGWLYNLNQLSEATTQKREDAEWRYQRALEASGTSAQKLVGYLKEAADADRDSLIIEQKRYENALKTAQDLIHNAPEGFSQYLHLGPNGQLSIDPKLYEVDWTSDMGAVFEDFIGQIEEVKDELKNSIDNLKSIRERAAEKRYTGRSEYGDLVNRIRDAFIDKFQKEIDVLGSINDAIEDAQDKLISKLQEKIDDDRNAREQEKQEQDLTDKATQLAYLQASGANPLEILKLQKEIDEEQQSYTDSLVDKSIEELQDANQKAADQRQQQIDIAQAQLDWWSENDSTAYAEAQLNEWLKQGDKVALKNIEDLLSETETKNLSSTAMQEWKEDTENAVSSAQVWREQKAYNYYTDLMNKTDTAIDTLNGNYTKLSEGQANLRNYVDENGDIQGGIADDAAIDLENSTKLDKLKEDWEAAKTAYADAAQTQYDASNKQLEAALQQIQAAAAMQAAANNAGNKNGLGGDAKLIQDWITAHNLGEGDRGRWGQAMQYGKLNDGRNVLDVWRTLDKDTQASIHGSSSTYNYSSQSSASTQQQTTTDPWAGYSPVLVTDTKNIDYLKYNKARDNEDLQRTVNGELWYYIDGVWYRAADWEPHYTSRGASYSLKAGSSGYKRFATGGLADFAGPAWLDGTKSAPELVLNSTDTENFIALRNILAEIVRSSSASKTVEAGGNNYYNIDVHVDSIDSDYDIDSAAERIKELITADAMYRNVNAIQQIR